MVNRISDWQVRAPTAGMETQDLLRNAYAKEKARFLLGQQARQAWLSSFADASPMTSLGGGNRALPRAARQGMQQRQYQVGEVDDTLSAFDTQIDQADRLLEVMRKAYDAAQPGFADYAKQIALTLGPRLIGL